MRSVEMLVDVEEQEELQNEEEKEYMNEEEEEVEVSGAER